MFYLNTETVENAYNTLTSVELDDQGANAMFYFLILKACGINRISYEIPNFSDKKGFYYASRISSLFAPNEKQPKKYGFLNPFTMRAWPAQPISEPLKNWIGTRLKNNICGGGMQWRNFIDMDTHSAEIKIKFKYDYLGWLKTTALDSKTINIFAMAVWSNRYTCFEKKVTAQELIEEFIRTYKIEVEEKSELFNSRQDFELEFTDSIHDAAYIRSLIGQAPNGEWKTAKLTDSISSYVMDKYEFDVKPSMVQEVSVDLIRNLLNRYHQLMLAGPPGTSKSYFANKISKEYDEVIHVQFHPQYTYQSFVGGYIVDGTEVKFKEGVILQLINESSFRTDKKYLIIIDEFNRANVSQVLGEVIQCLDRNQSVDIEVDKIAKTISLPENIDIIATMNTTDRTLGTIDYAIKRRFMYVYCQPDPNLLIDLCPSVNFISLCDFLIKLNARLFRVTGNRDLAVGHAVFLNDAVKQDDKYVWDFEEFRIYSSNPYYPLVLEFAIKILRDMKMKFNHGSISWYAFLHNSNDIFEKYVRKVLAKGLNSYITKWDLPKRIAVLDDGKRKGYKSYVPDILVDYDMSTNSAKAVLDAKNKLFDTEREDIGEILHSADMYQLAFYCDKMKTNLGGLIYPAGDDYKPINVMIDGNQDFRFVLFSINLREKISVRHRKLCNAIKEYLLYYSK